jgi:DNA-binding PadR family transcriptional regulator
LEDDIVDVHMEMLEKHRLVEEEVVTRIGTSKYYIISEHGKRRVLVVYRIISVWLPLVMQQNTSLILSYFCFPLETLKMRAHMRIKHKHTHRERYR